ncbi:LysR substrate-binding domain-containing protein [Streptomyces sp. NPDC002817]|uniref:LysR substrate-binding domain-containing protein n=1 Tax=Streptomyces sp. NPDC088357 TaxID=3154655 RepID=UPI003426D520
MQRLNVRVCLLRQVGRARRRGRDLRGFAAGESGSLSVGYSASIGYETAPALLAALAEAHPGISTSTRLPPTAEILAGVADGTLDVGLVRCPPPTPQLVRTLVRLEPQSVLMPEDHPLAAGSDIDIDALADDTVLVHARHDNPEHYDAITGIFDHAGISPGCVSANCPSTPPHARHPRPSRLRRGRIRPARPPGRAGVAATVPCGSH